MLNGKKDVNTQGFIVVTDAEYSFEDIVSQYDVAYAKYDTYGERHDYAKTLKHAFRLRATRFEFNVLIEDFKRNYPMAEVICFKN